jgi:hypothetical protein
MNRVVGDRVRSRTAAARAKTRPGSRQQPRTINTARPLGGDLAAQRSLLGNVDGRSGERAVSSLQRTYGNAAVTNLLQPVAQRAPAASAPAGVSWRSTIAAGGLSGPRTLGGEGSPHALFRGDTLVVTAVGPASGAAPSATVEQRYEGKTSNMTVPGSVLGGSVEWRFPLDHVGSYSLTFHMPGAGPEHTEHVEVASDFNDFLASCTQAHDLIDQKYQAAIDRMTQGFEAYKSAWQDQEKDLVNLQRQERIAGEVILGLIFAGAGGLAGGWIGDVLKGVKASGPVTDGGKDLVKYLVRTTPRLGGPSGSMPVTPGDSVDRTSGLDITSAPRGREAAAGVDPIVGMTRLMRALGEEKLDLLKHLDAMIGAARTGRASHGVVAFEEDPRTVVERDQRLEMVMADIQTDTKWYLRMLWHAWLEEYSWVVTETPDIGGTVYQAKSTIDDPWPVNWARKTLAAAADKCDESLAAWEHLYIRKSREEAEKTAGAQQARHPLTQIGIPP